MTLLFLILIACDGRDTFLPTDKIEIKQLHIHVDKYEVSTGVFDSFIEETRYKTTADSIGWSSVFDLRKLMWVVAHDINWQNADGQVVENSLPVTQVSYYDACAYCEWKGGRLPTAIEWDRMAGNEIVLGNVWQGVFPIVDEGKDGYAARKAPVGQFQPNKLGIHDLFGNVWEWTSTTERDSMMIIKGGSFLCDRSYCSGYKPKQYQSTPKNSGLNHLGFRCVYD